MTVHYEFKLKRQAWSLFQVKIGLAGLTVKSKATELNSKARTTESKKFWLLCQVQRVEVSVVHTVDRFFALYCTWSSKLQLTRAKSTSTRLLNLPHLLLRKPKKSHAWLSLVIGIWTAVSRTPHSTSAKGRHFKKIINKNNEIEDSMARSCRAGGVGV